MQDKYHVTSIVHTLICLHSSCFIKYGCIFNKWNIRNANIDYLMGIGNWPPLPFKITTGVQRQYSQSRLGIDYPWVRALIFSSTSENLAHLSFCQIITRELQTIAFRFFSYCDFLKGTYGTVKIESVSSCI